MKTLIALLLSCLPLAVLAEPPAVSLELDEAEAAVKILEIQAEGGMPGEADWERLWRSHGYHRLLARETAMGRADGFQQALRDWLMRDETVRRVADFRRALAFWRNFDPLVAGNRAARYLPDGMRLEATLYPVIKHTSNSFVFDLETAPSIFLNVDPAKSPEYLEAVMTHELHHVGLSRCGDPPDYARLSPAQQNAVDHLGIFGEGLAVLATAGDPLRHPHYYSDANEYLVWERDVARVGEDVSRLEAFFTALLDGRLDDTERRSQLFSFISTKSVPQGAAYTVGWKMAAMVERRFGHNALLQAICDPRKLMRLYNEAAGEMDSDDAALPLWSNDFLAGLEASG